MILDDFPLSFASLFRHMLFMFPEMFLSDVFVLMLLLPLRLLLLLPIQLLLLTTIFLLRIAFQAFPCYDFEGVYYEVGKYTPGCRFTAGTPDGEDTPKWKETLAARQEDAPPMAQQEGESPLAQPNFDSPKKTFTHSKSSGITPPDE